MWCEYADRIKVKDCLICTLDGGYCPYVKWCITDNCTKSRPDYIQCSKRNGGNIMEEKKDEILENVLEKEVEIEEVEVIKNKKEKTNREECKVIFESDGFLYFEFKGDTLRELNTLDHKPSVVTIEYVGGYGKPDFKVVRIIK